MRTSKPFFNQQCLMTVRRHPDVIEDITVASPANIWAHPDGTPLQIHPSEPPCIKIGDEIMEIIRCVDIEEGEV